MMTLKDLKKRVPVADEKKVILRKKELLNTGAEIVVKEIIEDGVILSRLVDTFFSRISLTMPLPPKFHNTAYVLLWEEDLHWQSRSSGCSNS